MWILWVIGIYALACIIAGIVELVVKIRKMYFRDVDPTVDFTEVDAMDGELFERFIARVLLNRGFKNVRQTASSGDFGVDVLGEWENRMWAFQCKRYIGNVGVHAVQEVYSGAKKYNASVAVVVTNSWFTDAAKEMAKELDVLLWDRYILSVLMGQKEVRKIMSPRKTTHANVVSNSYYESYDEAEVFAEEKQLAEYEEPAEENATDATIIGAGIYVFGEDIPLGKYDLKVVSGEGVLKVGNKTVTNLGIYWQQAKEYHGLSLEEGEHFSLNNSLQVEITRSKAIEIK